MTALLLVGMTLAGCAADRAISPPHTAAPSDAASMTTDLSVVPADLSSPFDISIQCPPRGPLDGAVCVPERFSGPGGAMLAERTICDEITLDTQRAELVCAVRALAPHFACAPCLDPNCVAGAWRCTWYGTVVLDPADVDELCTVTSLLTGSESLSCHVFL